MTDSASVMGSASNLEIWYTKVKLAAGEKMRKVSESSSDFDYKDDIA
jgi:hypothetical protein